MDDILSKSAASGCAMDDAFDALVAAWTAGQTVLGKADVLNTFSAAKIKSWAASKRKS